MSDYCRTIGKQLLANGYLVVPIRPGLKSPAISSWQKARLSSAELDRYPSHGVGILCGQGDAPVVGIDVDISHPVVGPAVLSWCRANLGETAERVGAAPRVLLAYRAAAVGWTKGYSVHFLDPADPVRAGTRENRQQVEILGLGQQFVAYHIHPDTQQEYAWTDMMGGLVNWPAMSLPVVSEAQIDALLVEVARLVRATPGVKVLDLAGAPGFKGAGSEVDDLLALSAKVGMPLSDTQALVGWLKNEGDSYDTWCSVGMALHHEYVGTGDEAAALDLWRTYGARSSKDRSSEYGYKWSSFGKHSGSGSPITLRWLIRVCNLARVEFEHEQMRAALDTARRLIFEQKDSLKLGGHEVVGKLKELLGSADPLVRTEIIGAFQAQYKALTKTPMPISQARALLVGPRSPTVKAKRPLTEFGNAERMLDRFGDGLMYVPEIDAWYLWTGIYWRRTVKVEIEHLAKETIKALPKEANEHEEESAQFYDFCAISQQARMVANVVKLASSDPRVATPAAELDVNSHLLGVKNGVVDLRTGSLLPPDPEYRITLVASCNYDPTADCPLFKRTTRQVFYDDEEMVKYFLRTIGYAMMGNPREEVMFIPFGNGANGKSTLLNTVREVMGHYARSAEAASFISDPNKGPGAGGPREDLVRLRGSRFVYVNEPDESGELREGAVKSMTGGDSITARGMFSPVSIELNPTWVVFMSTNHKPIVKGTDNGIWRRLVLLPFTRNFEDDPLIEKDRQLKDKLLQEKEGVLNLLVKAALEYQRVGLTQPSAVKEARDAYRNQMDLLAEWLDECCDIGQELSVESKELWQSWEAYARNRGLSNYIKSSISLGRRLETRFPSAKQPGGVRKRQGLALKSLF